MVEKRKSVSESADTARELNRVSYKTLMRVLRVFGGEYRRHWKLFLASTTGLLGGVLLGLLLPWPLKLILDHVVLRNPLPVRFEFLTQWIGSDYHTLLAVFVVAFVILQLFDSLVSYLYKIGLLIVGARMMADIRERIFAHLQRLSLSFHESLRSGDMVYRLTADLHELPTLLLVAPLTVIYRSFTIVSYIVVMMTLNWRLALVAFSVIPLLSYFNRRIGSGVQSATRQKRSKESEVTSLISENVTAMALVQAYGREDLQQARFEEENRQSLQSGLEALRLSKAFKRVSDILVALGTAGVVYYGGSLALEQAILPGTLVLFVSYLRKLYSPVDKFAEMLLDVAKAQVSGERLLELIECDMVMQDRSTASPAPLLKGRIEYRNVSFAYRKGVEVLRDLNITVATGETIAVVGQSGAGKSTFVSLLLRFYDPQEGQILIDGRDIRDFTLKSLRAQMTIVMQDARLFNKTVRDNIEFGKSGATEEEIIRAAKLAQAHDFIMEMPEGYNTMIYEGGDNLSGGQRQRINIARAIIRDTPVLILDEPATALDAIAEDKIHRGLRELTTGRTTFIIAHRFSTIARADKILVLEKGRPHAFGTHEQLIKSNSTYRELYELQVADAPELLPTLSEMEENTSTAGSEVVRTML